MELHVRLVHLEAGLRVVEVRATNGEQHLGSALAEAATVQEAEALALERLLHRLRPSGGDGQAERRGPVPAIASAGSAAPARQVPADPPPSQGSPQPAEPQAVEAAPSPPVTTRLVQPLRRLTNPGPPPAQEPPLSDGAAAVDPGEEPPTDPEDWSQELAALEVHLRRLGWARDQEGVYLQRAFGHPSRSRLTRYSDLRAYLLALEGLERGSDPSVAPIPLRRSELLAQGDVLLSQLGWSAEQGRAFLERELQRVSRQQLSDVQLLQFNMLLEGELLEADASAAGADHGPDSAAAPPQ